MQGGRLVVPTPGVVSVDEVASPVVPTALAGLVVSGVEPAVAAPGPEVGVGDPVVEPIVEPGPLTLDVVPIDPLVALPIVLDEPGALVPGEDRELPLSPVPELNVAVEPGELAVPANEPGVVPANEPGLAPANEPGLAPANEPGLAPANEPGLAPANEPGLAVPGTLVLAPGMPVVAPGTPTPAPGTVEVIGALDIAVPRVPVVGTHGRDEIGCPVGFVITTGGFV
jgi:hypothetical protein